MLFSTTHQPRYAVYVVRHGGNILVGRYFTLATALTVVRAQFEMGETVYHDVN